MGAAESARGSGDGAPPVGPGDGGEDAEARTESAEAGAERPRESESAALKDAGAGVGSALGFFGNLSERRVARMERRRNKIREEIERNRRGEYKVPTWVLAVALIAFIAGWVAMVVFS